MKAGKRLKQYGFTDSTQAYNAAVRHIELRKKGLITPYKTGWERINRLLGGGIQPSTVYTIGGRPGHGKSTIVNEMLYDMCELNGIENTVFLYWSWEMTDYQQIIRGFSGDLGCTVQQLLSAELPLNDTLFSQILKSREKWVHYPIYFMSYSCTPKYIYNLCKDVQGTDPGLRIVNIFDHTRLAKKQSGMRSEEEKIRRLYHVAQQLSVNFGAINIILSQLNREIENDRRRNNPIPRLSDFFGADAVAQFSNVAIALQRPEIYHLEAYMKEQTRNLLAVHVLKNRDGDLGWIPFDHNLAHNTIKERYPVAQQLTYQL